LCLVIVVSNITHTLRWRKVMLLQIAIITVIQTSNQYIIIPNYNLIKRDMGVSDLVLGSMTGLYIFLSGISTVIWSYIADAYGLRRKPLLLLSILAMGLLTYIVYLSENIIIFFLTRVVTGLFLGAVFPIAFSMIADFFESERRAKAYMFWYIISGVGMALGFGLSAVLGALFDWRYPIRINALLLILLGTPLSLSIIEPSRGMVDIMTLSGGIVEYTHRFSLSDVRMILSNKSNIYVAFEEFVSTLPQGVLMAWITQYVVRELEATEVIAIIFLGLGMLGGFFGSIIAHLADKLYTRSFRYRPLIAAVCSFMQVFFFAVFLLIPLRIGITEKDIVTSVKAFITMLRSNILLQLAILFFFLGMMFNSSIEPIKNSVISDVNLPEQRAIVASSISTIELFFRSAGIAVAGLIIDLTGNIRFTLLFFVLLYLFAGNLWLRVVKHYPSDIEVTRERLKVRVGNTQSSNNP